MVKHLRDLVWQRAENSCEYCRMPQDCIPLPHAIDHIIALQHRGATVDENLALACFNCNSYKGPNIAGLDPETRELTRLFHPRIDIWSDHFEWSGALLIAKTPIGRVTLYVLDMNEADRVAHRKSLLSEGQFPPT